MYAAHFYSDEWNQEERDNLINKTSWFMKQEDLPEQLIKPISFIYGPDEKCVGYHYLKPSVEVIALKELFQPDNLNRYKIDSSILGCIAKNVLDLLVELSLKKIYPGFIDLSCLYVPVSKVDQSVYLYEPELFQVGNIPSSYHWYPSDSKLYQEEFELFDEERQKKADGKLLYKILTAASKGNAKIPPNESNQENSWVYWSLLSKGWKECFLNLGHRTISYEELRNLFLTGEEKPKEKAYALITILRQAEKSVHEMSRELYLLQEKLESHPELSFEQGFVLGNKHPFVRPFREYKKEYRSQLGHVISDYSYGETLLIASEMMEEALIKEERPSVVFIFLDGEIKNDKIFHISLKRLAMLKEKWYTKLVLVPIGNLKGEGYQQLKDICMKGNKK